MSTSEKLSRQILKFMKSPQALSTVTSPITESMMSLNPEINLKQCKHPCQTEDLILGRQVPPQESNQLTYDQFAVSLYIDWLSD